MSPERTSTSRVTAMEIHAPGIETDIAPAEIDAPSIETELSGETGISDLEHTPAVQIVPKIRYYYDYNLTEEDVPEADPHQVLGKYLVEVLEWLFRSEGWLITRELYLFVTEDPLEKPVAPDVAVFTGVRREDHANEYILSWHIEPPRFPPPRIVIEIASDRTAIRDIEQKPLRYQRMGVEEYFFYDPRPRPVEEARRLRGWRFPPEGQVEIQGDPRGWLWSETLQSWLVPDDRYVRLYDSEGRQRPTGQEAEQAAKEAALAAMEAERIAKEAALAAITAERIAKDQALAAMKAEQAAKDRAWARLRELGIDPETF